MLSSELRKIGEVALATIVYVGLMVTVVVIVGLCLVLMIPVAIYQAVAGPR